MFASEEMILPATDLNGDDSDDKYRTAIEYKTGQIFSSIFFQVNFFQVNILIDANCKRVLT